ncbi:SDR family oxidoreductase [Rhodococcus sp. BP-316]|jgi:nucleoside-diphosphate-sugar epimerase|uniref:NAD-dependent epimerase/dehydratase family protein n=1 Tax=unclassified Rhodococcus (in: high G+C Gram-positive bacteria) TaxID=192944 RepID=UPI0004820CAD|nr:MULTISPECIES: SDR family oxidoreductase [unclassified Rhodococcus (in: high G+C Gram-positive bacteria)]MBY6677009.1 SDR family oxidoreductase [Rhodococcus sp. BP-332]MBY6680498.1 SDR family oxidoreductase [Rhodococcus sp. BP-316]
MRVLVTGHQGYLGTVMVPLLQERGHTVVGLDSGLFADCVLGDAPADPVTLATDLRDVVAADLTGVDAVVHLAALSNDPLGTLAPEITHDINHHASVRLARAAKDAGVGRFLYASTCSVYGAAGQDAVTEDAVLRPLTPYAVSKVRVEDDVAAMADDSFAPVFLRNATAFGYSPRLRADIVVNDLTASAFLTGRIVVKSDGTPWRPLVHARDIAYAFAAALEAPVDRIRNRALNIGTEANNVTVRDIAETVADVTGAEVVVTGEYGADPRSYRVDFSAAREVLPAFVPEWSVRAGAEELVAAYARHGLTADALAQRFTRLARVTELQRTGAIDENLRRTRVGVGSA